MIPFKKLERVVAQEEYKTAVKNFATLSGPDKLKALFHPLALLQPISAFGKDPFGPVFSENDFDYSFSEFEDVPF